jgi:hypothetical protein
VNFSHIPKFGILGRDTNSGRRPNFGHISRLLSTSQLRSMSWLWSYLSTPVMHHGSGWRACHMSYLLICERLRMVELDDYNILQIEHLVGSRSSKSTWPIQRSKPQHLTAWHVQVSGHVLCDQWALSPSWSERNSSIQKDSVPPITRVDQGLRMSGQAILGSMPRSHGTKT